ncbi:MAG: TldD/PmbA family protein [Clostridiales bacterium]|nr:TldD/PmbA family protein [Clostridiales bacterium]
MSKFEPLKEAARRSAEALGITEYELYYNENGSIGAETYRDEISAFSSSVGGSLSFRCIVDGKMGYASTQLLTEDEVAALVSRAVENSRISEKDEEAIIFGGAKPEDYLPIEEHEFVMPDAATIKNIAMDCRNVLYAADEMVADGTECGASAGESTIRLFNSKGLDLSNHVGNTGAYMYAVLDNKEEKVYDFDSEYNCFDTLDKQALADKVLKGAHAKFGAGAVKTGKYNIVFSTKQASNILSTFVSVFYAEDAQKGLSLLKGKVGEKIAADIVTIIDDPFYPGNTMQISFDGEGVPTRTKNVVENGELKTLLYNLDSAKKDGVDSTGNAARGGAGILTKPYTFYIKPGEYSRDELLAKAGNGIYITEMKGFHAGANAITGDFSIESAGFMIEDGKLTRPVKSLTIAGNFFDLLKQIEAVGSEIELRAPSYTRVAAPDILVPQLSVAGE